MVSFCRTPAIPDREADLLLRRIQREVSSDVVGIRTEWRFYVESSRPLDAAELGVLRWLLAETFEGGQFGEKSFLEIGEVMEVGTRLNRVTPWSSNAVSICRACGIGSVTRLEASRRYRFALKPGRALTGPQRTAIRSMLYDRMTETPYPEPLTGFETGQTPEPVAVLPLIEEGRSGLSRMNREMGLGMDEWDIDYYHDLFAKAIGRNPTNVECFQLGQANSEHSRHWFFKGRLVLDGREMPKCLLDIVRETYLASPRNSVIAFSDNASAIRGYPVRTILPEHPGSPSPFRERDLACSIVFTAETHNFPTGVAPFPGAETGTGGRQRDSSDTGRGSLIVAGTAAYCVGNLRVPGYRLPWEDESFPYPGNLASPLEIEIRASDGASDYGNKFGEPLILGFTRSFGLRLPDGERREWIKPIMFTGGIGQMDARHERKEVPERGMRLVKIGGPAYRIGMGGGAASSMIQGENLAELDFNAVQRGDAEMAKKTYNVIRACVEMGDRNPILSLHDQGAGGRCNVETEIIHPAGARIEVRKVWIGDPSLSVLEIWGAEYQEQHALLIWPDRIGLFQEVCEREKVCCAVVGEVTGDGRLVLHDEEDDTTPVNLELSRILGKLPQKTFRFDRLPPRLEPLRLPREVGVREALERVLRLLAVGSKRFLTTKVDRSVTGLVAQQQCVGPLQLTLSDFACIAQSHLGVTGAVTSIGEQPIKGLLHPAAMARMSVGEAITNLAGAGISGLEDIRCSANWMWAAKLPGEGAAIYDAACAMRDMMIELGIAVDGGKDSLSMATQVAGPPDRIEVVKSPGELTISAYVGCPDIRRRVTPDIQRPGESRLLAIDLGEGRDRLGGSALAQVWGQIGDEAPDVEDAGLLRRAFLAVQSLLRDGALLAYHDRSDGGLIVALLEMAFAGNCGLILRLPASGREGDPIRALFSEELGMLIEYLPTREADVRKALRDHGLLDCSRVVGETTREKDIVIEGGQGVLLKEDMRILRDMWEETSYALDRLQANPECVEEERRANFDRKGPDYRLTFRPSPSPDAPLTRPRVAIVREEGSNGDREMTSAFFLAGFEPWDVTMTDLLQGRSRLSDFRGVVFVGGFSYSDVLDSAKGWAGAIRFSPKLWRQFQDFYGRTDTFSLGVCNGCQLMALLGWVPWQGIRDEGQPRFIRNLSGRFESRWSTVRILPSPALMLRGMEGSVLGIWVAHGEGRVHFPVPAVSRDLLARDLAPIRFVDDEGGPTDAYPFNPNGSPSGITALCSADGRHLAMMPHPERAFLLWQWPWMPADWRRELEASPWLRMFQNARRWCG